jgi:hypothetical protein
MLKNKECGNQPAHMPPHKWAEHPAGLLLLVSFSLILPMLSFPLALAAEEAPQREESKFDIYVGGKDIGSESFSIRSSADAVESTSIVNFRDPGKTRKKVRLETQLSMDSRFSPRNYQLRTDVEGQKGTITGIFTPGEATFDYKGSDKPIRRGLLIGDRCILLDTNVFHHFTFVARLYDLRKGGTQTIEVVIPQELEGGKLKVSEVGLEKISIRGKKMDLHHLNADSGVLLIDLWIDDQKMLYKIEIPANKIDVIRNPKSL